MKDKFKCCLYVAFRGLCITIAVVTWIFFFSAFFYAKPVLAQTESDWAFLNTLALPWRCGDKEPRFVDFKDWNVHWDDHTATGAAIDLNLPGSGDHGVEVLAPMAGRAKIIKGEWSYGTSVIIDANNGWSVRIAHLLDTSVLNGEYVQKGQVVGRSDSTTGTCGAECSSGPHIHLEFYWNDAQPDPTWFNTVGHFLFSYPTEYLLENYDEVLKIPRYSRPIYSNNCGTGTTTSLYWNSDVNGPSVHYSGFGKFRIPSWFDNQASSMLTDAPGVILYENIDQQGGARTYQFNQSSSVNLTGEFNNGVEVNDNTSSLQTIGQCRVSASGISDTEEDCLTPTPTRIPNGSTPTATPAPGLPADSWYVDYFTDSTLNNKCNPQSVTLFENPPQRTYLFKDWGDGAPYSGCPNDFSARMWRTINFPSGNYTFHLFADDKAKVFVDGNQVIDQWNASQHIESRALSAGSHELKVEFQDSGGAARVHFWWDGPGFPAPPHETKDPNQWYASFWPNTEWFWDPFMTYNDGNPLPLDKIWGVEGASYGLQNDNFSSTYERTYRFDCGDYRFDLKADDYAELDIFDLDTNQSVHQLVAAQANNLVQSGSPIKLSGKNYEVRVKHKEYGGEARLYVNWTQLSSCPAPTSTPTPTNTPLPTDTPIPPPTVTYTPKPIPTFTPVPQVQFGSPQYTVNEGGGSATISVNLNSPSAQSVTVNYTTGDQTATAGADYVTSSGSLIFNPGQTSQSFTVPILDDTTDEPDEAVTITLNNATNATLGSPNTATVIIVDNDESGPSCNTITQIPRSECEVLEVFFTSTNANVQLDDWFTTNTPCTDWRGIVCSGGHITQLNLDDWALAGNIPPELGNLSYLEHLDLSDNNDLIGPIPSELGKLTKLTVLRLWANPLSGSVPSELGNLINLRELSLHWSDLSGPLPMSLTNLTALESFWFYDSSLCEPVDTSFQDWLDRIVDVRSTGVLCGSSTAPTPPSAPVNLQATPLSSTEIKLIWTDTSSTEIGFFIDEGTTSFSVYNANTTTFIHSGLVPNSRHCYHMYAFNDYGNSPWTDWACATTLSPTSTPTHTPTATPTPVNTPTNTATPIPYWCDSDTVALWHLDESTGNSAQDACGVHPGTLSGTYSRITGRHSKGVQFGDIGFQGKMLATSSSRMNNMTHFTVEFWINRNCASTNDAIMGKSAPGAESWIIGLADRRIQAEIYWNGSSTRVASNTQLGCGTWTHAAVTYDGSQVRIYINGNLDNSAANTNGVRHNTSQFWIGNSGLVAGIDEVRISDIVRTSFPTP